MPQPLAAPCTDCEHAKAVRKIQVLQSIVETNFPLPTIDIACRGDAFRAAIDFDDEVVLVAVGGAKLKCAVRAKRLAIDAESQDVFRIIVFDANIGRMRSHVKLHGKIRQRPAMAVPRYGQRSERSPGRYLDLMPVNKRVTDSGQKKILGGGALHGRRVIGRPGPAGGAQSLQSLAHHPLTAEGLLERAAQFEELQCGERRAVEGRQDFQIAQESPNAGTRFLLSRWE